MQVNRPANSNALILSFTITILLLSSHLYSQSKVELNQAGVQQKVDDWTQFRGANSAGIGTGSPPIEFAPGKNELWHIDVGAGHSSPCVVGNSIFLTTFDQTNSKVAVVCLERETGQIKWRRETEIKAFEKGHPSFNPASSSPTSDGQRVVAYFGSLGLICYSMTGELIWKVEMPTTKSFGGNATSPAIVGDQVILYRGNYVDHFLIAINKRTGEENWRIPQSEKITGEMACTACPIFHDDKLIVHTARAIQAIDLKNGEQIWIARCATTATSTPILSRKEVIVAAWNKMGEASLRPEFPDFDTLIAKHDSDGNQVISRNELPELWIFHRPDGAEAPMNGGKVQFKWADSNKDKSIDAKEWRTQISKLEKYRAGFESHGLLAIPINSSGEVAPNSIRTLETEGIPEVPSPICDDQHIYMVKNGGVLTCVEIKSGKRIYRTRTGGKGTHYASPIVADQKIYSTAGNGLISVLQCGDSPKVLAKNQMNDEVYATPAIVDGVIYVRTHQSLFAFGNK